jgi:hypothetical protein
MLERLLETKKAAAIVLRDGAGRAVICPDMGGRVFVEVGGQSMHRLDLDTVQQPDRPFNNFGGTNLWPAPEGGPFGFNYQGNQWYVQPAINNEPFAVRKSAAAAVELEKQTTLLNRQGTRVKVRLARRVAFAARAACLDGYPVTAALAVETRDEIAVLNDVATDQALLAAWNLEQFTATPDTVAFVQVANPQVAINFDFYEPHPKELIGYRARGFTFRVDGHHKGQIGIKQSAQPAWIGFYDLARRLVCIKENRTPLEGLFFNIADNDQPAGPYSAADTYSIFNSDADMLAFELETIGPLEVAGGKLRRAPLVSVTTYAIFKTADAIRQFVTKHLGGQA